MNRPPQYPAIKDPSEPRWRRWWLALLLLWGVQSATLLSVWPEEQPRLHLWLWSAVMPLCWALVLALRALSWRLGLFERDVHRRAQEAAVHRWWQRRSLGLPVEQALLLGPAGDVQANYRRLMASAPTPKTTALKPDARPQLHCPNVLNAFAERPAALARSLASLTLALPELTDARPPLRAIAWVGDESSAAVFAQALAEGGLESPESCLPLNDLADLDNLIDAFHHNCRDVNDWLLCAGVVSLASAEADELPGEAGFVWLVSHQGRQLLHRGEYQPDGPEDCTVELCAQLARYGGLEAVPPGCLALDQASQEAFVAGEWPAAKHQLARHWGVLADLAPFVAMSLALLHTAEAREPCGWLSQDGSKRLAIGMAVPHGNS